MPEPTCPLCGPLLTPIIEEGPDWRVALNLNQNLLGKCIIVLHRHEEDVTRLSAEEWGELHNLLGRTTARLRGTFQPEHFNYAFLQNQDRHVHLHVIPRYAAMRRFEGLAFEDPDYPGHYAVPTQFRQLTGEQMAALAASLQWVQPSASRR